MLTVLYQVKPTKPTAAAAAATTATTAATAATADNTTSDSITADTSNADTSNAVVPVSQPQVQEGEVVSTEPQVQQVEVEGYNYCSTFMREVWSANMTVSVHIHTLFTVQSRNIIAKSIEQRIACNCLLM
jgi:hypothetical protein